MAAGSCMRGDRQLSSLARTGNMPRDSIFAGTSAPSAMLSRVTRESQIRTSCLSSGICACIGPPPSGVPSHSNTRAAFRFLYGTRSDSYESSEHSLHQSISIMVQMISQFSLQYVFLLCGDTSLRQVTVHQIKSILGISGTGMFHECQKLLVKLPDFPSLPLLPMMLLFP